MPLSVNIKRESFSTLTFPSELHEKVNQINGSHTNTVRLSIVATTYLKYSQWQEQHPFPLVVLQLISKIKFQTL